MHTLHAENLLYKTSSVSEQNNSFILRTEYLNVYDFKKFDAFEIKEPADEILII